MSTKSAVFSGSSGSRNEKNVHFQKRKSSSSQSKRNPKRKRYTQHHQGRFQREPRVSDHPKLIDFPTFLEKPPAWHEEKKEIIEKQYPELGMTPKHLNKPGPTQFAKELCVFLKKMRLDPFKLQKQDFKNEKKEKEKLYAKARHEWCIRHEPTGSVFEGLKANDDIEFDFMFVMKGSQFENREIDGFPGYYSFVQKPESRKRSLLNKLLVEYSDNTQDESSKEFILSPEKVISKFESSVHRFLKTYKHAEEGSNIVYKIKRHGPAIQVDFYKDEELWYKVDLVPCYELGHSARNQTLFVAKPPKLDQDLKGVNPAILKNAWRISYSLLEKEKLNKLDSANGRPKQMTSANGRPKQMTSANGHPKQVTSANGRPKQVIRFLKGLNKCDVALSKITSYHWKNLLFHVMDKDQNWDSLHSKIFELLWYMKCFVEERNLPVYYNTKMNLFSDLTPKESNDISKRLNSLVQNEKKFDKLFESISKDNDNDVLEMYSQPHDDRSGDCPDAINDDVRLQDMLKILESFFNSCSY